ncbi:MAG: hypothetical protein PHD31_03290 [Candidatus Pacebacteria bacterium]|jgi:hypothetical protein|nr:hypothetical protein [Candidatus Paceibacterota bacterium]
MNVLDFANLTWTWLGEYINAWGIVLYGTIVITIVALVALLAFVYIYLAIKKGWSEGRKKNLPELNEEVPSEK